MLKELQELQRERRKKDGGLKVTKYFRFGSGRKEAFIEIEWNETSCSQMTKCVQSSSFTMCITPH